MTSTKMEDIIFFFYASEVSCVMYAMVCTGPGITQVAGLLS